MPSSFTISHNPPVDFIIMDATDTASSQHEKAAFSLMKKELISNTIAMIADSNKVRDSLSANIANGNLRGIDHSQIGALTHDTADHVLSCRWPDRLTVTAASVEAGTDNTYSAQDVETARGIIRHIDAAVEAFTDIQRQLKASASRDIGPNIPLEEGLRYLEYKSTAVLNDHADEPSLIEDLLEDAQAAAYMCDSQLLFSQALRQTAELFRERLDGPLQGLKHVTSSALGYKTLQDALDMMANAEVEGADRVKAGVECLQAVLNKLAEKTGVAHAIRLASDTQLEFATLWSNLRLDDAQTFADKRKQMLASGDTYSPYFGSIGRKGDRVRQRPTNVSWFDMKPTQLFTADGVTAVNRAVADIPNSIGWSPSVSDAVTLEKTLRSILGEWATRRDSLPQLKTQQVKSAHGNLADLARKRITKQCTTLQSTWSKVGNATMQMFDDGLSKIESARHEDKNGAAKSILYDALKDTAESDKMLARAILDQLSAKEGSPEEMQSIRQLEEVINRTTKTQGSVAQTWTDALGASAESVRTFDDLRKYVPGSISKTGAISTQAARRRRRRQERSDTAISSTTATDVKSASQPQAIDTTDAPETSALPERPAVQPSWANIVAKWASQSRSTSGLMK